MKAEAFIKAYNESRNGANKFIRHPLVRSFAYSDGVQEVAETGCYWLLDILATELPSQFVAYRDVSNTCVVTVQVADGKAHINAELDDGKTNWSMTVGSTDMPEGEWQFYVADEGDEVDARYRMILLSEY